MYCWKMPPPQVGTAPGGCCLEFEKELLFVDVVIGDDVHADMVPGIGLVERRGLCNVVVVKNGALAWTSTLTVAVGVEALLSAWTRRRAWRRLQWSPPWSRRALPLPP